MRPATWACLVALTMGGCAADPAPDRSGDRETSAPARPDVPPVSGPARVELWHCGVRLLGYPEDMWELRHPPFDATNAPESFTGHGRASVPRTDRLVYVDDGGQRLVFVPGREVPPVLCD